MKVTSTEFSQNVGRYQDAAQHGPVAITRNGRTHTVLISAAFFDMSTSTFASIAPAVRPYVGSFEVVLLDMSIPQR